MTNFFAGTRWLVLFLLLLTILEFSTCKPIEHTSNKALPASSCPPEYFACLFSEKNFEGEIVKLNRISTSVPVNETCEHIPFQKGSLSAVLNSGCIKLHHNSKCTKHNPYILILSSLSNTDPKSLEENQSQRTLISDLETQLNLGDGDSRNDDELIQISIHPGFLSWSHCSDDSSSNFDENSQVSSGSQKGRVGRIRKKVVVTKKCRNVGKRVGKVKDVKLKLKNKKKPPSSPPPPSDDSDDAMTDGDSDNDSGYDSDDNDQSRGATPARRLLNSNTACKTSDDNENEHLVKFYNKIKSKIIPKEVRDPPKNSKPMVYAKDDRTQQKSEPDMVEKETIKVGGEKVQMLKRFDGRIEQRQGHETNPTKAVKEDLGIAKGGPNYNGKYGYDAGHMDPAQQGGSNRDVFNFFPQNWYLNRVIHRLHVERPIQKYLESDAGKGKKLYRTFVFDLPKDGKTNVPKGYWFVVKDANGKVIEIPGVKSGYFNNLDPKKYPPQPKKKKKGGQNIFDGLDWSDLYDLQQNVAAAAA